MKKFIYILFIISTVLGSCRKYEDKGNPNSPSLGDFASGTSLQDLNLLVAGIESSTKTDLGLFIDEMGIVGREVIDLTNTDPRFTGELLGKGTQELDRGGFLTTRSYASRYVSIRTANTLLASLDNTNATLTEAEKSGYRGFAKTMIAFQLLYNANMQYENGIRVDVADPLNLGPFTSNHQESLSAILDILNEANGDLKNSGEDFAFVLSDGFDLSPGDGNNPTPDEVDKFNRALAARVAIYMGNKSEALSYLSESFMVLDGSSMYLGISHNYTTADGINPLDHQDNYMADTMWVFESETGDTRLWKIDTVEAVIADGITSNYHANIYSASDDNVIIIRNEELILIYAEANIGSNNGEALSALNIVRSAAGLPDYSGAMDDASLTTEMLRQRRYSLFGEGHRWVDMRRYDRLDELTIYRPDDDVYIQFPRPQSEL